ncbi:MAG TPA: ATP-binding cassette domain-containing protein [Chitinophagales bacterium]|nr:ATP-binding cassette domain-containing protein [Chitinophagales bacterium]
MPLLSLQHIIKQYGAYRASDDVSFNIPKGKIFGLLGPNGAGKTTLIRMITRILYPDSGNILFNGEQLTDKHTENIGYMPEERGLYKKMKVGEHLIYLGRLKGLSNAQAKENVLAWLKKFEIENWYNKHVEELSKGMSQKVQFIATVLHNPQLLILDEPFSGLDPINSKLIEEEIRAMSREGKTIIFSTHRMEQVEEICDEIVLVNKGRKILEGEVKELKQRFKQNKFRIAYNGEMNNALLNNLNVIERNPGEIVVKFEEEHRGNSLLKLFVEQGTEVSSFNELLPSINEIFIRKVNSEW